MKCSVCVISYNGYERLRWMLKSALENAGMPREDFEVIVVDDGSRSGIRDMNKQLCQELGVTLIQHETNKGITRSWNRAVSEAQTDLIALLNDDLILTNNWLKAGIHFIENNENVGTAGYPTFFIRQVDMLKYQKGVMLAPRDPRTKMYLGYAEYKPQMDDQKNPPGVCAVSVGAAFCFRKSVWEKVGKFEERMVSMYEDFDFGTAMLKHGYQNYQLRNPIIFHCLSGTFSSNPELNGRKCVEDSKKVYIEKWGGEVGEIADKLCQEQKKEIKVKFLDSDNIAREEFCCV